MNYFIQCLFQPGSRRVIYFLVGGTITVLTTYLASQ